MTLGGIPLEFCLFAVMLTGVAVFHRHALTVALAGLIVVASFTLLFGGFSGPGGGESFVAHLSQEWVTLLNLFGLLLGFAVVARHFELTRIPEVIPRFLPDDWKGGLALLALVFVLSAF